VYLPHLGPLCGSPTRPHTSEAPPAPLPAVRRPLGFDNCLSTVRENPTAVMCLTAAGFDMGNGICLRALQRLLGPLGGPVSWSLTGRRNLSDPMDHLMDCHIGRTTARGNPRTQLKGDRGRTDERSLYSHLGVSTTVRVYSIPFIALYSLIKLYVDIYRLIAYNIGKALK
jgi:hypothetical protein